MADILFLTHRIPFPPNKGEKIRPYQILQHLRSEHRIHLGCLIDDPHDYEHEPVMRVMTESAHFARVDRRWGKLRYLDGLRRGAPLSFAFFRDAGLMAWVDRVLRETRPEIAYVFSSAMAQYVIDHPLRPRRIVMDFADVDGAKWAEYATRAGAPMRWVYRREARLVLAEDRRIARAADASLFVSEPEAELFRTLAPESAERTWAVGNGVDAEYFSPRPLPSPYPDGAPTFVFTGHMGYWPNVDAVCWFADAVLPGLRRRVPGARFAIVGADPAPAVRSLAADPGILVTGRVPDVRPYMAHAAAAVAPLRIARGIQNKVLEAMSMALPVIASPQAWTGIDAEPGRELLLAESADDFVEAAAAAAAGVHDGMGAAARRCVVARYSWPARLAALDAVIAAPRPRAARAVA
ncbi:TIGR03087 family PEP-CTERM/XrtA system glycosyltransferase [Arenibaculum pallidiluteum]|uniref:TIGR03087 family PEP-CTERM/XrtA system glycosyltransferase n=1 Tax=Arenibaculum pallidiluteum TaxID=2812559 RepID=UPI001A969589|nr:TIGR03087 family PEP-CTERM/XrtA system glycosyltransferase [Arenibaculum pallidiluteum]